MNKLMTSILGANWRTSLLGIIGAIGTAIWPIIQNGAVDPKSLLVAAGIAAWGFISKDAKVTGGTMPATTEAATRTGAGK